jgi:cysteinyl-tRNA synthetase
VIRFFFAKTHYRRPPDFSLDALKDAEKGLQRVHRFKDLLESLTVKRGCVIHEAGLSDEDKELYQIITSFQSSFEEAMDDDFNSPKAIATMFEFITQANSYLSSHENPNPDIVAFSLDALLKLGKVLTLFQDEEGPSDDILDAVKEVYKTYLPDKQPLEDIDEMIEELLCARQMAREQKDWGRADAIRKDIECLGFEVQDTSEGSVCRKLR